MTTLSRSALRAALAFTLLTIAVPTSVAGQDPPDMTESMRTTLLLPSGTVLTAETLAGINSRRNEAGDRISARVAFSILDQDGRVVIPADAELRGVITRIKPEHEDELRLTFYSVVIDGSEYPVQATVISLPVREKRRGNTAGDVAKVGAGALVGGIAGRIIGGNSEGTAIGALTGAAAGAGTAVATRTDDVIVDPGALIQLQLTAPFRRLGTRASQGPPPGRS